MKKALLFSTERNSKWIAMLMLVIAIFALSGSSVEAGSLDAQSQAIASQGCVIPPSGPWPPCATGGNQNSTNNNGCIIPESGPWPPCARNGGNQTSSNNSNNNGCIIPPSGPWPPCATGGGQSNGGASTSTVSGEQTTSASIPNGKSKTFSIGEVRLMFVNLWNTRPHYETLLGRESAFAMDNNVITLISSEKFETINGITKKVREKMEFSYRISVNNGELAFSCIYLEANYFRVDENDCAIVGDHLADWLTTRIKNDIWANEILSVEANGDSMVIGYR